MLPGVFAIDEGGRTASDAPPIDPERTARPTARRWTRPFGCLYPKQAYRRTQSSEDGADDQYQESTETERQPEARDA